MSVFVKVIMGKLSVSVSFVKALTYIGCKDLNPNISNTKKILSMRGVFSQKFPADYFWLRASIGMYNQDQ